METPKPAWWVLFMLLPSAAVVLFARESSIASRLPLRLLCGVFFVMALMDFPVVVSSVAGRVVGVVLFGMLAVAVLLVWRRCARAGGSNAWPHEEVVFTGS